ncbi:MAG: antibiotic biosynthesis monooxygenase [Rhodobacteraceae bacterium]|nr:antibiotic biosynthesis monooxygenase [Paracoccaceae bacterium]
MSILLHIIARIQAAPGQADALETEMRQLVDDTRKEPGCLRYNLTRGTENGDLFVFIEEWESHDHWRQHMEGAAIRSYRARIGDGMVAASEVMQLGQVA